VNWTGSDSGLDVADSNATLAVSNDLNGSGMLTKTGAGTLTLLGANAYGVTMVQRPAPSRSATGAPPARWGPDPSTS
jgi:hypothetical protein